MEDLKRDISDLKDRVGKLADDLREANEKIDEQNRIIETHSHSGSDGTTQIYNEPIILKSGTRFQTGRMSMEDWSGKTNDGSRVELGVIVLGEDAGKQGVVNKFNSAQLTLANNVDTNGTTNQTFYYGFRKPVYGGKGNATFGGTTLTQQSFSWERDELVGAFVNVYDSDTASDFDSYEITSNTRDTLTVIGGTWTVGGSELNFFIYMPIYFGSADNPWRRLYTFAGSAGGIRFGVGNTDTTSAQNGLLYLDTDGILKFRRPNGSIDILT